MGRERLAGGFRGVGGHVALTGDVLVLVLLHLEGFDAVRELDELDAAAQARLGHVRADLRQDVVVGGRVAGDPDVLQGLVAGGTPAGVGLQEAQDEGLGFLADFLPIALVEDDAPGAALLDQVGEVLRPKGRVPAQQGVGDHAERPHVDRLPVAALEHDFWGGVAKGAGHRGEDFVGGVKHLGDAEVGEDQFGMGVTGQVEKVLRF